MAAEGQAPTPKPGRTALVTGAGQGIGRACALALARTGHDLILLDRIGRTLAQTAQAAVEAGAKVFTAEVDITDYPAAERAVRAGEAELGRVAVLVNNAGCDKPGTAVRVGLEDFRAVLEVHLVAALGMIKLVLPGMCDRGFGRIINISSIYGARGAKGEVAYVTAKAGLLGLTKSVAQEAGARGVTVNVLLPGLTRTPTIEQVMASQYKEAILQATPLRRMAEPEEVAAVVTFLASEAASYVSGAEVPVSGGWGV